MPLSSPQDSSIAIVGDGFGSLIVYATAIYLGFDPDDIVVYGPSETPVGTYQQFAYNLGQTVLRSESESHFLPADWPTFAQLDAYARRSAAPLARSIRRRYNPGVPDILAEATAVKDAGAELAPRLTPRLLADVIALVPDEWLEDPEADRAAYLDHLTARAAEPAAWLP